VTKILLGVIALAIAFSVLAGFENVSGWISNFKFKAVQGILYVLYVALCIVSIGTIILLMA
jgi:Flp pilus assembly pilin Flp